MKIVNLKERLERATINVVVYGAAGAGKTSLIRTLQGKVLVISAEAGLLSLAGFDADVVEVKNVDDLREVHAFLDKGGHGYNWVCLDSLSEIGEICLLSERSAHRDVRAAYGALIEKMLGVCRAFRDLPVNVYMSAKEERFKDESTGRLMSALSMPGAKLGQQIPYLFDEVLRLVVGKDEEGNVVRALQTSAEPNADAKDRSGKLDHYEKPDLGAVYAKIMEV